MAALYSSLRRQLRRRITEGALARGIHVGTATARASLVELLGKIRPLATDKPLIRIGGPGDGGYLVPDDLDGITRCFSPGVSNVANFELEMAQRGICSHLADFSVDGPPVSNPLFTFEKKFLGNEDAGKFMTLRSWVERHAVAGEGDYILQMDIEGGEYDVLMDSASELLRRFRIIVVEFHQLEALFTPLGYQLIAGCFVKLLRDFKVVHVHPNNCAPAISFRGLEVPPVMEFTFLRHDRISRCEPATVFPHPLDAANVPLNPDYPLPRCWWATA